jgi:hypothetical protein
MFFGSFLPSWIRIQRPQGYEYGSGSTTLLEYHERINQLFLKKTVPKFFFSSSNRSYGIHVTPLLYLPLTLPCVKVGADEGIYTLNLNELHENAMDLLYPRRTVWMFVIKDILMTLSGRVSVQFS